MMAGEYAVEYLRNVKAAIKEYDSEAAKRWIKQAVDSKVEPLQIMDAAVQAMREIGEGFQKGDLFLPDLMAAADTFQQLVPSIEQALVADGHKRESIGVVVLGTVAGDIHTIGKAMVGSLLTAEGFQVVDVGVDVQPGKFVAAVKELKPNILAMSALLSTTAPEAKKVIEALKQAGLRDSVKVMVGGGAITEAYAQQIGADGYDPSAPGAVTLARRLLGL